MPNLELDKQFLLAVEKASNMTQATLPQDVQLRLYAYFKQANYGNNYLNNNNDTDLRNAFKINAWMQVSHLSSDQAKELYIEEVNFITKKF